MALVGIKLTIILKILFVPPCERGTFFQVYGCYQSYHFNIIRFKKLSLCPN